MTKYPALMHTDSGFAAIARGHGLTDEQIQFAETDVLGLPQPGERRVTEEVHYLHVPRMLHCSRHPWGDGFGCDNEGEWHGHWFEVQPTDNPRRHFTVIRHTDAASDGADQ